MSSQLREYSSRQRQYLFRTVSPLPLEPHPPMAEDREKSKKNTLWEMNLGKENLQIGNALFKNYQEWLKVLGEIHAHPISNTFEFGPTIREFLSGSKEGQSQSVLQAALRDVFVGSSHIPELTPAQLKKYAQAVALSRQPHAPLSATTDIAAQIVPPRSADTQRHSFNHLVVRPLSVVIDLTAPTEADTRHLASPTQEHVGFVADFLAGLPDYLLTDPQLSQWKCLTENTEVYLMSPAGNLIRMYDRHGRLEFSFVKIDAISTQLLSDIGIIITLVTQRAYTMFKSAEEKSKIITKRLFTFSPPRLRALE